MLRLAILCLCVPLVWSYTSSLLSQKTAIRPLNTKIINGQQASVGQFPWQVALYGEYQNKAAWFCGGSIISKEWIVTAGHCLWSEDNRALATAVTIHSGSIYPNGSHTSVASHIILHEGYNPESLENDIGLVSLMEPLTLSDTTAIIVMSGQELGVGVTVTASGWGLTSDNAQTISSQLNYVTLQTISNTECFHRLGGVIYPGMVCAVDGLKSICSGDSGGPVVINPGSDPRLVAVVSFSTIRGCETGLPTGYTRISTYVDWIRDHSDVISGGTRTDVLKSLIALIALTLYLNCV